MICNECKSRNPEGHKFCRECGAKLTSLSPDLAAAEAAREERERLGERVAGLMAAAWTLTDQKRWEQAIPLAREAALLMPDSTAPHSLLAMLYERTDQDRKAIAAMERVVALNPESEADKLKLDQLQRGVHVLPRPVAAEPSDVATEGKKPTNADDLTRRPAFWVPAIAAGATAAVILGVGISVINRSSRTNRAAENNAAPLIVTGSDFTTQPTNTPATTYQAPPPGALPKGTLPPASEVRADPFASLGLAPKNTANPAAPAQAANRAASVTTPPAGPKPATLPLPFRAATPSTQAGQTAPVILPGRNASLPPIIAVPPSNRVSNQSNPNQASLSGTGFGAGDRLPVGPPSANAPGVDSSSIPAAAANRAPIGDGYIRITVGPPANSNSRASSGSGATPQNLPSSESALARARRFQSAGRYADAIPAYQEALGNGSGSAGDMHQSIAECHRHLGHEAEARSEYQSAIRSYESQAASGRGVAAAQRGAAACRAALEALGG